VEKLDPVLRTRFARAPEQIVGLIVRTDGDPTPHMHRFVELGFTVGRRFRMLPGVSVTGQAQAALTLARETWILKIEEDRPITTM
jgi:hypothetical protein